MRIASKGFVNRDQEVTFLFDSKPYKGFVGDTVASALLANNVNLVGRLVRGGLRFLEHVEKWGLPPEPIHPPSAGCDGT